LRFAWLFELLRLACNPDRIKRFRHFLTPSQPFSILLFYIHKFQFSALKQTILHLKKPTSNKQKFQNEKTYPYSLAVINRFLSRSEVSVVVVSLRTGDFRTSDDASSLCGLEGTKNVGFR
jgi:cytosine/uracil/thiamine/allantoin permease